MFEQPDSVMETGSLFLEAAYSATEVLHALMADSTSVIFERLR